MIEAPGVVERIDGDTVWVRVTEQQGGCGRCHEPGGCGGAKIAHALGRPNDVFRVHATEPLCAGQSVTLLADDRAAMLAGLTSYGVPTLGAMSGAALGTLMADETGAIAGLMIGLVGAMLMVRTLAGKQGWRERLSVTVRAAETCSHHD